MVQRCDLGVVLCRYDVEQFQKIEALIGQQMERFEHEEEAALLLCERVTEAQKLATMQVWSFPACVTASCSTFEILRPTQDALTTANHGICVRRESLVTCWQLRCLTWLCQRHVKRPCTYWFIV